MRSPRNPRRGQFASKSASWDSFEQKALENCYLQSLLTNLNSSSIASCFANVKGFNWLKWLNSYIWCGLNSRQPIKEERLPQSLLLSTDIIQDCYVQLVLLFVSMYVSILKELATADRQMTANSSRSPYRCCAKWPAVGSCSGPAKRSHCRQ